MMTNEQAFAIAYSKKQSGTELVSHVIDTMVDFSSPPTARELMNRIVQVGRLDAREAQRAIQIALDRGRLGLGEGLRLIVR